MCRVTQHENELSSVLEVAPEDGGFDHEHTGLWVWAEFLFIPKRLDIGNLECMFLFIVLG